MARPVRVQTTMVSAKTSKMPKKPCFTGSRSEVEAWAIGAEPSPASFENTPRRRPQLRQARTLMPAQTDCGLKAHTNMSRKTAGSQCSRDSLEGINSEKGACGMTQVSFILGENVGNDFWLSC